MLVELGKERLLNQEVNRDSPLSSMQSLYQVILMEQTWMVMIVMVLEVP